MMDHLVDGVLVRGATYLALALVLGPMFFEHIWTRARTGAVVCALVTAWVLAAVHATLTFADDSSFTAIVEVLWTTEYGLNVLWFGVTCGLLALGCIARHPLIPSALVALMMARLGHAELGDEWDLTTHVIHTMAASAWLGALLVASQRIVAGTLHRYALARMARSAAWLVGIITLTGIARVPRLAATLRPSAWTIVLAIKLVLFGAALAIALGHRRKRMPQSESDAATWARLDAMLVVEIWLVLCALLFAGLLSQLEPP